MEIFQMTTQHKHTVLCIEDKITICECLDKGSSKEITCEYKITIFYLFHVYLFDYLNNSWSQGGQIMCCILLRYLGNWFSVVSPIAHLYIVFTQNGNFYCTCYTLWISSIHQCIQCAVLMCVSTLGLHHR